MERPKFYRAIVVSLEEVGTLLTAIKDERTILQTRREVWKGIGDPLGDHLDDLAAIEKRLEEVKWHMEAEAECWRERMAEYVDSGYEDIQEEDDE